MMSTVRRLVREAAAECRAHPLLLAGIFAAAVIVGLGVPTYTRQPPVAIVTRSAVPTPTLTAPASAVPRQHHRTDQVPASNSAPPPSLASPGGSAVAHHRLRRATRPRPCPPPSAPPSPSPTPPRSPPAPPPR